MRKEIIGNATLLLADCIDVIESLSNISAILTDPPYGINYQSGFSTKRLWAAGKKITNDNDTYIRDQALAMLQGIPALVFGSRKKASPQGTRTILIWDKGPALGMGALDLPWKPSYEEIYVIGKGFHGKRDGAVIYCPPVQSMAKNGRKHPNEKPVQLLQMLLTKMPTGVILDPFMGSGSTGEACLNMGRSFIGIEIEPIYFDIACERLYQIQKQEATRI